MSVLLGGVEVEGLQADRDVHRVHRTDEARVGLDAVALGRRRLDLEGHAAVRGVRQLHDGGHGGGERAWNKQGKSR